MKRKKKDERKKNEKGKKHTHLHHDVQHRTRIGNGHFALLWIGCSNLETNKQNEMQYKYIK